MEIFRDIKFIQFLNNPAQQSFPHFNPAYKPPCMGMGLIYY